MDNVFRYDDRDDEDHIYDEEDYYDSDDNEDYPPADSECALNFFSQEEWKNTEWLSSDFD
jgi:hypothetical protein